MIQRMVLMESLGRRVVGSLDFVEFNPSIKASTPENGATDDIKQL